MSLFLKYVYVCLWTSVYKSAGDQERSPDPLELVTGGFELTNVDAGTQTQVLL